MQGWDYGKKEIASGILHAIWNVTLIFLISDFGHDFRHTVWLMLHLSDFDFRNFMSALFTKQTSLQNISYVKYLLCLLFHIQADNFRLQDKIKNLLIKCLFFRFRRWCFADVPAKSSSSAERHAELFRFWWWRGGRRWARR